VPYAARVQDFDLIVIGGGSGGISVARRAARRGARVALCEADLLGGTCVARGCVPKKLLATAAQYREHFADARGFGYELAEPSFSWSKLIAAKNAEVLRLSGIYEGLLRDAGVHLVPGRASLLDAHTVAVAGQELRARHLVIATGAQPSRPDVPGVELGITSDQALELPELPRQLTIVGAGYVGVELAGVFQALGSQVTLLVRAPGELLAGFDREVVHALQQAMQSRGIRVEIGAELARLERRGAGVLVQLTAGESLETDCVLLATGREPSTRELGLVRCGVALDARGAVQVDAYSRSSVPSIHAVGDCTDRLNLTPVAIAEGLALAETLFGERPVLFERDLVPSAVFSQPPLSAVGLSEEEARRRGHAVRRFVKSFKPLKHALTGRDERTTMKLVVDRADGRVLGAHVAGADAPEIVQGFAAALRCGITKEQLDATVGIHPTAAEELVTMRHERCGPFDD
jgi:glutathione reductase (NADPH)